MNIPSWLLDIEESKLFHLSVHVLLPAVTWAILIFVAYREWQARRKLAGEIRERMQVEQALQRRSRYLKALAEVNQLLLSNPGYREAYEGILRLLGLATGASRVYIFENHPGEEGKVLSSQRAEWCGPGVEPQIDNQLLQRVLLEESPCRRWLAILLQGKPVTGKIDELGQEEREFLEIQQIKSILILPMHVNGTFFGFVGFDQCDRVREWEDSEIYLLRSAAMTLCQHIERKQALEEIASQHQLLEERVKNRTAQLELANEELEAFCYTVSHDLRGPLTGIRGFSQLLLDELESSARTERDYILRVLDITDRTLQLIDDLLSLSRAARTELQRTWVDLSEMAQIIAAELQLQYPHRRVEFAIQDKVTAHGDEGLLKAVIQNLLNNSWKYTSRKSLAEISFGSSVIDGETVYHVKDNGAGFRMEYVDRLFQAFSRLHTAHEFPGTGVGLATVRRIVQRHGGRVWAEGEVEKGASFYFTLPDLS
ncbi:cyanobacterial phytochrome B [Geobacter sp. OR-1]|uniref:sensor histidine kinase n=1 Tax=Geobacter sp. OR-1 TaxID=1266765 RepID=UPI000541DBF0|nr:ATP-binding protein [Geobacter sp. OR-1]GAM08568.1 cyanobacterial phytochrome B [Geobacter sp. OR-1]